MSAWLSHECSVEDLGVLLLFLAIKGVFEESYCFSALSGELPQGGGSHLPDRIFFLPENAQSLFSCIYFCS